MGKLRTVFGYAGRIARRECEYRAGKLRQVSIDLTYRCNLRCEICSLWRIKPEDVDELTLDEWLRVIDEFAEMGVREIGLIGGEPTIVKGFVDIMRRIKSHKMKLVVTTNATTLPKFMSEFCSLVDTLYISVDAHDKRHDRIRGIDGLLDRVIDSIRQLVAYRREQGLTKPEIHIHATVTKTNPDVITDMVRMGDELGIDVVSFQYITCSSQEAVNRTTVGGKVIASDRYTTNDIGSLLLDDDGIRILRAQLDSIPSTKHVVPVTRPLRNLSDHSLRTGDFPVKRCVPISNQMSIRPNGDVTVCSQIEGMTMGNLRQNSVREIWCGEARRKARRILSHKLFPVCRNCCAFSTALTPTQLAKVALDRKL